MVSCGRSLPEAYGIYADTSGGQVLLHGQGVQVAGNILRPIYGVKGPSGPECRSVEDFIVYHKDIQPDSVGLVRFAFQGDVDVPGFVGLNRTKVNLWLPKDRIDLTVKPVEQRRDMYIMTPVKPLEKGFYAIYVGSFGDMGIGGNAYDFVVGTVTEF